MLQVSWIRLVRWSVRLIKAIRPDVDICSPCSATKAFSSGMKLYAEGNTGGTWTKSMLRWGLLMSTRGR
eukprot:3717262-Pleurochrysis_carterae.AAC.2